MQSERRVSALAISLFAVLGFAWGTAQADIANTLHNFTPSGPGTTQNPDPVGLCRFCHAPHGAGQTIALWNRALPTDAYDLYESSTLEAQPGQPTGTSRLCLSCHDGTIALGNVLRTGPDQVAPLGPVQGRVLLSTDLSDDHPISFLFDESLVILNGELVSPSTLTGSVQLDSSSQVQCTSCHNPHEDRFPKFLVMSNENSGLCVQCHAKRDWDDSSHATSSAVWSGLGPDPWPGTGFSTVAQNGCLNCHDPHSAPHPERLLRRAPLEQVCLSCHSGEVAQTDIAGHLAKLSHHPVEETSGTHDPREDVLTMDRHVSCPDCHNPHSVQAAVVQAPDVPGPQRNARGVDLAGSPVDPANFAYEVCFRCHGLTEAPSPRVVRLDDVTNVRLEIHPANPSYHPVTAVGTNPSVISLISPLTPSSRIYCHDCHNTDERDSPGPTTPFGPHGSTNEPILRGTYPLHDFVNFDEAEYGLCLTCHRWDNGLRDDSAFEHKKHMENADAACVDCHDPHGSRIYTHLINFLRFDENGTEVVRPSIQTGRLEFIDEGDGRGSCYLNCHGEEHCPKQYIGPDKGEVCD